jgi:hypothetical protein
MTENADMNIVAIVITEVVGMSFATGGFALTSVGYGFPALVLTFVGGLMMMLGVALYGRGREVTPI